MLQTHGEALARLTLGAYFRDQVNDAQKRLIFAQLDLEAALNRAQAWERGDDLTPEQGEAIYRALQQRVAQASNVTQANPGSAVATQDAREAAAQFHTVCYWLAGQGLPVDTWAAQ
ncbi:hypothetical protein F5972_08610 [Microbispora cellulosiformans]|uniref:Uncharacterized protein n=1 Tax=Microbispora cellulosiformans TaxID=2614688 RepID=A0A5J5K5F1_9ACTN|nr:hypothetical protein [Microbispora cellulosiformans]KAA9379702.1 hypothetical protein F5972_08610 [Microbispora cellulosiformans]